TAHYSCAIVHLGNVAFETKGRLDFDPKTEKFVDCDEANAMLTKEYRKPFELPKV
ncbi:MAG: gfo/Idh/MocA family oxidoreductase, partial [Planctomycetaceae bacterium]|nr:gfo/Idh/MocA family oxidoreductase [Planctomycetaceae bacterium]